MKDKSDTYCGKCIKADVCGMEDVYDPATTFCAYRVEAQPHGEWKTEPHSRIMHCSNCNAIENLNRLYVSNFCYSCGASMVKKEGDRK